MRLYETVFIANPELGPEELQPLFDKMKGIVSGEGSILARFDEWGHKKLAYEVKKKTRGYYALMEFCGDGALVNELERNLRLDDRVLKYMTVLKDKAVDMEALQQEIEAAKERGSRAEPAAEENVGGEIGADYEAAEAEDGEAEDAVEEAETGEQEEEEIDGTETA